MGKVNSKISSEDCAKFLKKTSFTKKEIYQWYKCFYKSCPEGYISKDQLLGMYYGVFPSGDPKSFVDIAFNAIDLNNDGSITFDDFIITLDVCKRNSTEKVDWIFRFFDIDNDGIISKNELYNFVDAIYKMLGKNEVETLLDNTVEKRVDTVLTAVNSKNKEVIKKEDFGKLINNNQTKELLAIIKLMI
ncbi:frequenin-like protein [Neocallimastix californiae]|uniref:Frequenin-like protein n=1 Tax=Neocallimastix californiae TaxID=1754190 RepID=A0A1Y2B2Z0_9FUNG|nr:frequenin-like protein [Neocallimastix californiae]|eukprot:ORY29192.1 frequenin-like protein [Neocallimastix californiae]